MKGEITFWATMFIAAFALIRTIVGIIEWRESRKHRKQDQGEDDG